MAEEREGEREEDDTPCVRVVMLQREMRWIEEEEKRVDGMEGVECVDSMLMRALW